MAENDVCRDEILEAEAAGAASASVAVAAAGTAADETAAAEVAAGEAAAGDVAAVPEPLVTLGVQLAYNGASFSGFAKQPGDLVTVQGSLEDALRILFKQDVPTVCAGRTDAGVHARDQWVSFQVPQAAYEAKGDRALVRSLNALTHPDMAILKVERKADDFSARFDARTREYRYFIATTEYAPVLVRHLCWHVKCPLNVEAMQKACTYLEGEHDFKSFCLQASAVGKNTVRRVMSLTVEPCEVMGETLLCVRIVGSAFLHSMVRTIVGTLVLVGRGLREPEWVADVLAACNREAAGEKAPACGLVFWKVDYDNPDYPSAKERMTAEDAQRADEAPVVAYEKAFGGFSEVQRIRDEEMPSIMEGLDLSAFDDLLKDLEAQADEALLQDSRITDPTSAKADAVLAEFLAANCTSVQESAKKGLYGDGTGKDAGLSDHLVASRREKRAVTVKKGGDPVALTPQDHYEPAADPQPAEGEEALVFGSRRTATAQGADHAASKQSAKKKKGRGLLGFFGHEDKGE